MKIVFDDEDNFKKSLFPTTKVWELIKLHFSVETRMDLLTHCYAKFDKPFFAGLCKKLAKSAEEGDELCIKLFSDAGHVLARSIIALLPKLCPDLIETGSLSIVCVGSVWLSWDLMKNGFIKELNGTKIAFGLELKKLTETMALGASYMAADAIKFEMPRDYTKNYEIFHFYHQKSEGANGF